MPHPSFSSPAACCLISMVAMVGMLRAEPMPDAVTPDGGRYFGPLRDGLMHGTGRIEWEGGERYEGSFVDGRASGNGRMRFGNGEGYEGEFHRGRMQGRGRMTMPDGSVYVGEFHHGYFHGQGRLETADGETYEGTFKDGELSGSGRYRDVEGEYRGDFLHWKYSGAGEITYADGGRYRGQFVRSRFHGRGRYENKDGTVHEGDFENGEFTGTGTMTRPDGGRYEGGFRRWRFHGMGRITDSHGSTYEGEFVDGQLDGPGLYRAKDGSRYEGEFRNWLFHGQGTMTLPNGDVYRGGFARGLYEGQGTLTYANPKPGEPKEVTGIWRYGSRYDEDAIRRARADTEYALYNQRKLLDDALAAVAPREPGRINLYVLAVAGDGSQEVFRREVEFVRDQFAARFGTGDRTIALVNSRTTLTTAPMATESSIREALRMVAARMDRSQDILFVFLSSHGSKEHEFVLNQENVRLRGLTASRLSELLAESGIRWKVVVVSACYAGGFIDPIKDDHTLVITASRHDRRSFGCADENDFTYFGEAFFKDSLPVSRSFQEAFLKAVRLVGDRERALPQASEEQDAGGDAAAPNDAAARFSEPQMFNPTPIAEHLERWWSQVPAADR